MSRRIARGYVVAAGLVGLLYLLVPHTPLTKVVLYNGIGLSAVVAILVGCHRNRPADRRPWLLFAVGQSLFLSGDLFFYVYQDILGIASPFPSLADAGYLSSYPFLLAGLLIITRGRNPDGDRAALVEALIVATGLGVLSWVYLMQPYAHDPSLTLPQRTITLAYPLMDVLVLAVTARLLFGDGHRSAAHYLITGSLVGLLVADTLYGFTQLTSNYQTGGLMDVGWMSFYILWGAAALHPSMRGLADEVAPVDQRFTRVRLAVLAGVALVGPAVVVVESARGRAIDVPVVVAAGGVLFLLTIARMAGLVLDLETTLGALRRAGDRDGAFHDLGTALLAANDDRAITIAAADAMDATIACGTLGVAAATFVDGAVVELESRGPTRQRRRAAAVPSVVADRLAPGSALVERSDDAVVTAFPLESRGTVAGVLVAVGSGELDGADREALSTLASQVSLALESAAVAEAIHRHESEQRFQALVQAGYDVIAIVDAESRIRYVSPAAERVLGRRTHEFEDLSYLDLVHPDDVLAMELYLTQVSGLDLHEPRPLEVRIKHADGSWRFTETTARNLLEDPSVGGIVLTTRDITDRKELEDQLTHRAFHDPLTGLANRQLLRDRVGHALARSRRSGDAVAVMFIDIDDFKTVNDSLGHGAGDELLTTLAGRLDGCIRPADTAARLGGDEFAVLVEQFDGAEAPAAMASRIIDELRLPVISRGRELSVSASVGIALADETGTDADVLLRNADIAMYRAKELGKNRFELFVPAMHDEATRRLEMKADLQRAIADGELVLHYQPIVDLVTGEIASVEALVRWERPGQGRVSPGEFIPLAEETGLIVELGRWVIRTATAEAATWSPSVGRDRVPTVTVNVSARQLQDHQLVADVEAALEDSGLPADRLAIELTETSLMHDTDQTVARLHELKALGVGLAIDDFGTGYSSLSYLQRFPVDVLKIDKSFVDTFVAGSPDDKLAEGILNLATSLGTQTVAEGIEHAEQVDGLRRLDCRYGQGFLFSPPVEAAALGGLLDGPPLLVPVVPQHPDTYPAPRLAA